MSGTPRGARRGRYAGLIVLAAVAFPAWVPAVAAPVAELGGLWREQRYVDAAERMLALDEVLAAQRSDRYRSRYRDDDGAVWAWSHAHAIDGMVRLASQSGDARWLARAARLAEDYLDLADADGGAKLLSSGYQDDPIANGSFESGLDGWDGDGGAESVDAGAGGYTPVTYFDGADKYRLGSRAVRLRGTLSQAVALTAAPDGADFLMMAGGEGTLTVILDRPESAPLLTACIAVSGPADFVLIPVPAFDGGDYRLRIEVASGAAVLDGVSIRLRHEFPVHLYRVAMAMLGLAAQLDPATPLRDRLVAHFVPRIRRLIDEEYRPLMDGQGVLRDPDKAKPAVLPMNQLAAGALAAVRAGELARDAGLRRQGDALLEAVYTRVAESLADPGWWRYRETFETDPGRGRPDDVGHAALVVEAVLERVARRGDGASSVPALLELGRSLLRESGRGAYLASHLDGRDSKGYPGPGYVFGWLDLLRFAPAGIRDAWRPWLVQNLAARMEYDFATIRAYPYYLRLAAALEALSDRESAIPAASSRP